MLTLKDLLALAAAHNYLMLAMVGTLWARKLLTPESKFPLTLPPQWAAVGTAGCAALYGLFADRMAGDSWKGAALAALGLAVAGGFFDGLLTAIFNHGNAPAWAQALVMLVKDFGGGGGGTSTPAAPDGAPPAAPPAPPASPRTVGRGIGFALGLVLMLAATQPGCAQTAQVIQSPQLQDEIKCVETQIHLGNTDVVSIASACTQSEISLAVSLIDIALADMGQATPPQNISALRADVAKHRNIYP